ncbi:MAG: class I SAM-dependent methyltransferase [Alphaproteobacteria bacterium]|nr:SAM-dependent methyltransferase [Alphaproteobacteria bacterium]MDE2110352.1 class I SAM-dependent methyltransferase [Alphaproteobacteria bacterium]MDE2495220.1 class I SAM-dependent methyltransferase [Alphaproteobacteria bacterium]
MQHVTSPNSRREHWDAVYCTKDETAVSWFQERAERSLALIRSVTHSPSAPIIDVGGGASRLVDDLLADAYSDLAVLDVSATAIAKAQARLGAKADGVSWIVADITAWQPQRRWNIWHDRAVFHFLTEPADQDRYIAALGKATDVGAAIIMSCFSLDGPERCSGLPVQRYSATTLADRLGRGFRLVRSDAESHTTPSGGTQKFIYAHFERQPDE